jgi:hypothetical protein
MDNLLDGLRDGDQIIKQDCLVLDFADNTSKHRIVSFARAFNLPEAMNLKGRTLVEASDAYEELLKLKDAEGIDPTRCEDLEDLKAYMEELEAAEASGETTPVEASIEEVNLFEPLQLEFMFDEKRALAFD